MRRRPLVARPPGRLLLPPFRRRDPYALWPMSRLALPPGFTFTRSGTAQGLYGADYASAVYSSYATDVPRFERLSDGRVGLLLEGARTHLLLHNNGFDNAYWTKRGTGTVASQGGNWWRLGGLVGLGNDVFSTGISAGTAGAAVSPKFRIRRVSTSGTLKLFNSGDAARGEWAINLAVVADGESITAVHPAVTIIAPFTSTGISNNGLLFAGSGSALTVDVQYPTLEAAAFPSSPVETAGSTVTRNAETCSRSVTLPSGGFTVVYDIVPPVAREVEYTFGTISDGSANNLFRFYKASPTGVIAVQVRVGGSTVGYIDTNTTIDGARCRLAVRLATSQYAASLNGGSVVTLASASYPAGLTTEHLGTQVNGSLNFFGHILACNARPTVWRPPVSDAELQALSTLT